MWTSQEVRLISEVTIINNSDNKVTSIDILRLLDLALF